MAYYKLAVKDKSDETKTLTQQVGMLAMWSESYFEWWTNKSSLESLCSLVWVELDSPDTPVVNAPVTAPTSEATNTPGTDTQVPTNTQSKPEENTTSS